MLSGRMTCLVLGWIGTAQPLDTFRLFVRRPLIVSTRKTDDLPLGFVLIVGYPTSVLVASRVRLDVANVRVMAGRFIILGAGISRLKRVLTITRQGRPPATGPA